MARYAPRLTKWAHGRVPDPLRGTEETADIVQDVLLDYTVRADRISLRNGGHLLAYLRMAFRHRVINLLRLPGARAKQVPVDGRKARELRETLAATDPSPSQDAVCMEMEQRYQAAVARLSRKERTAITLRLDRGMNVSDITRAMNFKSWEAAQRFVNRTIDKVAKTM